MQSKKENAATATDKKTPQGTRIDGYFGPGLLRPGIGKIVQRTGEPQYCGAVVVRAYGYVESPNPRDPTRISRRFLGEIFAIRHDGERMFAATGFMPSSIDGAMKGMIDKGAGATQMAFEVWCEPDEENGRKTPLGYRYQVYDRQPRGAGDPLLQLAAAAGIIEPLALPAPGTEIDGQQVDPETGEIIERDKAAAD